MLKLRAVSRDVCHRYTHLKRSSYQNCRAIYFRNTDAYNRDSHRNGHNYPNNNRLAGNNLFVTGTYYRVYTDYRTATFK